MGRFLVTGRGGSGKSAICLELKQRGFPAFDADQVPGLCRWQDRKTGKPISVDPTGDIDFTQVAWAWQDVVLRTLLADNDDLILCGSASNQAKYHQLFDTVFMLMLDPKTHDNRLRTRDFDYGKHPDLRRRIVRHHQIFAERMVAHGAVPINTMQSVQATADDIESSCNISKMR